MTTPRFSSRKHLLTLATLVAGAIFAAILAAGCGPDRRSEPLSGPLVTTDPKILTGQRLFMNHCNQCHPGGAAGLGPALNNKALPAFAIKTQIREGFGAMPGFDEQRLSDAQVDDIVAYLDALRDLPAPSESSKR